MTRYNRVWIRRIWQHQRDHKEDPMRFTYVPFWLAVRATISLIFNLWVKEPDEWVSEDFSVAWGNFGTYWTDYGTGEAWDTLAVVGFRVAKYRDGSL